ncbi:MAG TPA: hypothetical protein PL096_06210 [Micropepsaceae bacterium]|nr:hypothetical protein [Micropepsaceae bacterium]
MNRPLTMTVRLGAELGAFVSDRIGEQGTYENVSEYVRDLIRKDMERTEKESFARLKAELALSFAAPERSYRTETAEMLIARNRRQKSP